MIHERVVGVAVQAENVHVLAHARPWTQIRRDEACKRRRNLNRAGLRRHEIRELQQRAARNIAAAAGRRRVNGKVNGRIAERTNRKR